MPDQWREFLGTDVLEHQISIKHFVLSVGLINSYFSIRKYLKMNSDFMAWFNPKKQVSLGRFLRQRAHALTKEFNLPEGWQDLLGQDVLNLKISVNYRFAELGYSVSHAVIIIRELKKFVPFEDWYMSKYLPSVRNRTEETNIKRYGVRNVLSTDLIKAKIKATNMERFGAHCALKDPSVRAKQIATNLEKYGVTHLFYSQEFQQKIRQDRFDRTGYWVPLADPAIRAKVIANNFVRYGGPTCLSSSEIRNRIKETNLIKYGVEHPLLLPEIRMKARETHLRMARHPDTGNAFIEESKKKRANTNLRKYGVGNPIVLAFFQEKRKRTCLSRYGFANVLSDPVIREKYQKRSRDVKQYKFELFHGMPTQSFILQILQENGVEPIGPIPSFVSDISTYTGKCVICSREYQYHLITSAGNGERVSEYNQTVTRCPYCKGHHSQLETKLRLYVESILVDTKVPSYTGLTNPSTGHWMEIDLYIKDYSIGFEINGALSHNSGRNLYGGKTRDSLYHFNKTEAALDNLDKDGKYSPISLFHLWEFHSFRKQRSVVAAKLGVFDRKVYARTLHKRMLSDEQSRIFFKDNHLMGPPNFIKESFTLALCSTDEIVQAWAVVIHSQHVEILRTATVVNTSIIGGSQRMLSFLKEFLKNKYTNVHVITSVVDRDLSPVPEKCFFYRLGFSYKYLGILMRYYVSHRIKEFKQGEIIDRSRLIRNKLPALFPELYDPKLSEQEILRKADIFPLYNSGCYKFVLPLYR
ncbi:hypothetical protein AGMMS49991_06670 [Spirochaetia bacterium]|nr:hypothetical protein AGMMS49991_06670 [Spirochaetia bacterium]